MTTSDCYPACPQNNLPTPLRPVPPRGFDGQVTFTMKHVRWKVKTRGQKDWWTVLARGGKSRRKWNVLILWFCGLIPNRVSASVSRPGSCLLRCRPLLNPSVVRAQSRQVISYHPLLPCHMCLTDEFVMYCLASIYVLVSCCVVAWDTTCTVYLQLLKNASHSGGTL